MMTAMSMSLKMVNRFLSSVPLVMTISMMRFMFREFRCVMSMTKIAEHKMSVVKFHAKYARNDREHVRSLFL